MGENEKNGEEMRKMGANGEIQRSWVGNSGDLGEVWGILGGNWGIFEGFEEVWGNFGRNLGKFGGNLENFVLS